MSIRDKWILHVVLHQPLFSVLGSLFDYIALDLIKRGYELPTFFCFVFFFLIFLLNRWTLIATDGCYMLLSIFYYVVIPHDGESSSSSVPLIVLVCLSARSTMSPNRSSLPLFYLITVLIPLHGWGSGNVYTL